MINLKLNNKPISYKGDENKSLLTWLREEQNIVSAKNGCSGQGFCGACLLEVNKKPALACRMPMKKLENAEVVTIEGFDPRLKDILARAFVKKGALQCGFCTPGFLSRTKILLEQNKSPGPDEIRKALSFNLCRCTGYAKIIEAVILAAEALNENKEPESADLIKPADLIKLDEHCGVGQNQSRHDAMATALGQRAFIDDLRLPDMLHGALRFSDHPRAKVLAIHTKKAEKLPGVIRVFTGHDIPGNRFTGIMSQDWPVMVLEGETTRYIGDVLAGVVAKDRITAKKACSLIDVDYEILEPVTDPIEALSDKIKVHENGNLLSVSRIARGGDIDQAFENSDYIVSAEYRTQAIEHAFMEPEACIAKPLDTNHTDSNTDNNAGIHIYSQSQGIYEDRHGIANILGIPKEKVIVSLVPCGGAFGGKEDLTVQGHAALFACLLGQTVKVKLSREESIRMHPKRHPFIMNYKLGCDKKGRLTALKANIIGDTGAYASVGASVLDRAAAHAAGAYHLPCVDIESKAVYTNNIPSGAMRGFGVNQVTFAMECLMDELCEKAGLDPWQFRFDNALDKGLMTTTGQILKDGVGVKDCLLAVKEEYEKHPCAGLAAAIKSVGYGNGAVDESEALIEVVSEKKLRLHHGWTEMGQGIDTIAKQILCEALTMNDFDIEVISNTDSEAIGGTTTASRGTFLLGNSILVAAEKMKKTLAAVSGLSDLVGQTFKGRWFYDQTDKPDYNKSDNPETHFAYGYAAQVVCLDEKGNVEKVIAAHDAGRVINPCLFEGQIEGAVMMGLGYAFTENIETEDGRLLSPKMMKLGVPKMDSMPEIIVKIVEVKDPIGPFGAKGVGEIGLVPTVPAAVNALYKFDQKRRYSLPLGRKIR